ncbi:MAG TPA: hypothetical protein VLA49_09945 [Anaerolineales bacterium]|nr:hypothetical protein [Anaerolineales bacterium]
MKRILLLLIVIFLVTACSPDSTGQQFEVSELETAIAGTVQASANQPTNDVFPQTSEVETLQALTQPPDISTSAAEPVKITTTPTISELSHTQPVAVPTMLDNLPYPIEFEAHGTYLDVLVDDIPAGQTRTFSVRAMQGQVMSIATWRLDETNDYMPKLEIQAADRTVLCPEENLECRFWRGILPASQDYYVSFTADPNWPSNSFIMRVAVNPPGVDKQFFQYRNQSTGVLLTYNDAFAPTGGFFDGYISTGTFKVQPDFILHLIDPQAFEKTNLSAVYLTIGSSKEGQFVESCLAVDSSDIAEQVVGTETINGYEFLHTKRGGVAAGHIGEQESYRMVYRDACYEIGYHLHSVNIGNFSPGSVVEFDRSAIIQALDEIFSSLRIN